MIGNDVVDLKLTGQESNWRREGFVEKVFSRTEQALISTSGKPDIIVWLLWSMKEAAYKAHQREFNLPRRLNWLALECELQEFSSTSASGRVQIDGHVYFTTSEITLEYVYTFAEKNRNRSVRNAIFKASSSEAKYHLLQFISSVYSIDFKLLQLKKDRSGMPFLTNDSDFHFSSFSLTGHGRFSAYMLSLINCETQVKHS